MSLALPKKVRLGHRNYTVEPMHKHGEGDRYGFCDHDAGSIVLAEHQDKAEEANTFLHECLHGLYNAYGMKETVGREKEEVVVNTLANALCGFIRDNPAALVYLTKTLGVK